MNLLKDAFISTNKGKVSLKTILTNDEDYQLQYYLDEIQLAMLQLLSSLCTVVLQPTVKELRNYLSNGLTPEQYDIALDKIDIKWFENDRFMQSKPAKNAKWPQAPITKLISGIECSSSPTASGLFSDPKKVEIICPDCAHVLNYNLHMNIKGEYFGPTGATGIRGGGAISTLIAGDNLKQTLLSNTVAKDYFHAITQLNADADQTPMWVTPITGDFYWAQKIGLNRGLFALAYHIAFNIENCSCVCDVCGHESSQSIKTFHREKYQGVYGSIKNGRDGKAGWWPHPYTPCTIKEDGFYPICARNQNWQSWQELSSYIVGKETTKATVEPAYIIRQFQYMKNPRQTNLLVGGNIADQGSIIGRVYDLYSMPSSLSKHLTKITQVVDAGLEQKERMSQAFNKMFGAGYDKKFIDSIKEKAMQAFTANAQQIIQNTLLDVERKQATELRNTAVIELKKASKRIFSDVQRKYQYDLPLFKALVKGELVLYKKYL